MTNAPLQILVMKLEGLHAWVLHKYWVGDTSAIVTFFTREFGILRALLKAGRTPKKQALLQTFLPLWVCLNQKSDKYYVEKLECIAPAVLLTKDALFAAWYINELIYMSMKPLDAHPYLFDIYTSTLNSLANTATKLAVEKILRCFERDWLKISGYNIMFTHDVERQPINLQKSYQFIPGNGFQEAVFGVLGEHLLAFSEDKLDDNNTLQAIKKIMRVAVDHVLDGRPLKTRELYYLRRS